MIRVTGIRFRKAGKIYYFDPHELELEQGQHVIVETVRGIEYGTVVLPNKEIEEEEVVQPLKKVIRISTVEDDDVEADNKAREKDAFEICRQKIRKHELEMKLIDCEYTFDNNKLLFYFTADGRIDFRELVKDLASVFKTRIELRQVGVRDETKIMGSIGICGRTLCCHAHLSDFHPVSIKMAKDQNLSLNPTKISGVCGRLMCCLKYEEETYGELNKNLPRIGATVTIKSSGQKAEVINTNIIRQLVKLVIRKADGDPEILEMKVDELVINGQRYKNESRISAEEAKELKALEELEKTEKSEQKQEKPKRRNNRNKNRNDERPNNSKEQQRKGNTPNKKIDKKTTDKSNETDEQKKKTSSNRNNRFNKPKKKRNDNNNSNNGNTNTNNNSNKNNNTNTNKSKNNNANSNKNNKRRNFKNTPNKSANERQGQKRQERKDDNA